MRWEYFCSMKPDVFFLKFCSFINIHYYHDSSNVFIRYLIFPVHFKEEIHAQVATSIRKLRFWQLITVNFKSWENQTWFSFCFLLPFLFIIAYQQPNANCLLTFLQLIENRALQRLPVRKEPVVLAWGQAVPSLTSPPSI